MFDTQTPQEPKMTIGRLELQVAMLAWETNRRNGECMTLDEVDAMSAEQAAALSAETLWRYLSCVS